MQAEDWFVAESLMQPVRQGSKQANEHGWRPGYHQLPAAVYDARQPGFGNGVTRSEIVAVDRKETTSSLEGQKMQEIQIKLWRHQDSQDWSVEILGRKYEHIPLGTVDDLVDYFLVAAQQMLVDPILPCPRVQ